jgi:GTPase
LESKIIITGIVNKGKLISGTNCYLGPDNEGRFKIVEVVNIHCKKIPVNYVYRGQYCSLLIKSEVEIRKDELRRGMVLLDINTAPVSVKVFEADLWTIDGTKKIIKYKYQPVLNIKHIRQGCKIRNYNELFDQDTQLLLQNLNDENINLTNVEKHLDMLRIKRIKKVPKARRKFSSYENDPTPEFSSARISRRQVLNGGDDPTETNFNSFNSFNSFNQSEAFSICSTQKTKVVFEFMFNPEYLTIGSHIIINDQLIKAYGVITNIYK